MHWDAGSTRLGALNRHPVDDALAGLKLSLSMGFGNANSPKRGFGLAQRLKGLEDENRRLKKLLASDAGCFGAEGHPGKN